MRTESLPPIPHPNVARIARKAAHLVARLYSGSMTLDQESALHQWLAANPRHREEFEFALELWDQAGLLAFEPEVLDLCEGVAAPEEDASNHADAATPATHPHQPRTSSKPWASWWGLAASLALLIGAIFFAGEEPVPESDFTARYSTLVGERKTLSLPDGSRVTLNTSSSVLVDFSSGHRKVILDRGEAFFDVAKQDGRHFQVEAGSQSITVLGTKFNVQKTGAEFTLAVVEGVVAVHKKDTPLKIRHAMPEATTDAIMAIEDQYRLQAGAVLTFVDTTALISTKVVENTDQFQSWREGIVTFDNQSLSAVVKEINRYTVQKILIRDASVMDIKVSGVFHLDDIDSLLSGLEATFPIDARHEDGAIVLTANSE